MQIHNAAAKETIFAINHWSAAGADIGIGNSSSENRDWTGNAGSYSSKRLPVSVQPSGWMKSSDFSVGFVLNKTDRGKTVRWASSWINRFIEQPRVSVRFASTGNTAC